MAPPPRARANSSASSVGDRFSSPSESPAPKQRRQRPPKPAEEAQLQGVAKAAGRAVLPPRAQYLPTSKKFVHDLCHDVEELLDAFVVAWQEQCQPDHQQAAPFSPCQVFAEVWEEKGWQAVQFAWGESKPTRAAFWASTVRALTTTLKSYINTSPAASASASPKEISSELLLRGAAVLLALYVLCATTDESVRILPPLKPSTSEEDPADESETGWMIEVEVDLYTVLLELPALAGAHMDESMPDMTPAPSADLKYALAALHGQYAPRRTMKLRGATRVFSNEEWIREKHHREKPVGGNKALLFGGGGSASRKAPVKANTTGKKGKGKAKAGENLLPIEEKTLPPISAFILLAPTTYDARSPWPSNELATKADLQRQLRAWGALVEELPSISSSSINMHAPGEAEGEATPQTSVKSVYYPLSRAEFVRALIAERLGEPHYLPPSVPSSSSHGTQVALPTDRELSIMLPSKVPPRLAYRPHSKGAAIQLVRSLAELEKERTSYAQALRRALYPDDAQSSAFALDDDDDDEDAEDEDEGGAEYLPSLKRPARKMDEASRKLREEIVKDARSRTKAAVEAGRKKRRTT